MTRSTLALALVVSVVVALGCPTRPNPRLPPPTDGDSDADGAVDGDLDADQPCEGGELLCGEECVDPNEPEHCGGCDRRCSNTTGCACTGDPPACLVSNTMPCYADCELGELLCELDGADECVHQPDKSNCGRCGTVCASDSACVCRLQGATGTYACERREGGSSLDCTVAGD